MSIQRSSLRYILSLIGSAFLLLMVNAASGQVQQDTLAVKDSTVTDTLPKKRVELAGRQLTLSFDIVSPIKNALTTLHTGYEFGADYYLHGELYLVAEGGWGSSRVNYSDLAYSTTNNFVRVGFNKILLPRENPTDWGGMFMGLRLAAANIQRSAATYQVVDSLWGNTTGAKPAENFNAYWMEITGGVRVELYHGLLAGWNIRGKFMLNGRSFNDLSPIFIAGYGKGDKNAVFDFNFYLSYAIRWKRNKVQEVAVSK